MIRRLDPFRVVWTGQTRWEFRRELDHVLFGSSGFRLPDWIADGRAERIKHGSGRTIYRVRTPDEELYVKHFRPSGLVGRLRQWARQLAGRSRARKEFHFAQVLESLGVPTIEVIALGERRQWGLVHESILVSRAVPDGAPLYEWIESRATAPVAPRTRRALAAALARLVADVHNAGIEHRDLHERNIILRGDPDGQFELVILDLHELEAHSRLRWSRAVRELSRMGRYFTLRTSAADRLRFFRIYANRRNVAAERVDREAKRVEASTIASRADFWHRRATRSPAKNSRIVVSKRGNVTVTSNRDLPDGAIELLLADPESAFRDRRVRWLKDGRATRVAEVTLPGLGAVVYKQYYFRGWAHALVSVFRKNQANRAWRNGATLLLRELPTPAPLALIERRWRGVPMTSFLITELIPGSKSVVAYLDVHLPGLDDASRRRTLRQLVDRAARLMRQLHERGVTHPDLKASNVLASTGPDVARPAIWFVDLDGARTWLRPDWRRRIENLARFHVSFHANAWVTNADRLRFLRVYLGGQLDPKGAWKDVWREIGRRTNRKIQRNTRRGRAIV